MNLCGPLESSPLQLPATAVFLLNPINSGIRIVEESQRQSSLYKILQKLRRPSTASWDASRELKPSATHNESELAASQLVSHNLMVWGYWLMMMIDEHELWSSKSSKKLCYAHRIHSLGPWNKPLIWLTPCVLEIAEVRIGNYEKPLWSQSNCFDKFLRSVTGVNPSVSMLLLPVMISIDKCRRTSRLAACVRKFQMANLALTCFDILLFSRVMLF